MKISPYVTFDGCCEEAFAAYAALLGGEVSSLMRWSEAPGGGPPDMAGKVMHANLRLDRDDLLGCDQSGTANPAPAGFSVTLEVETNAEAERIYAGLAEGGSVRMAIGETFFAQRFASLIDRFGIPWLIISGAH